VNLESGHEVWSLADFSFRGLSGDAVVAFRGAEGSGHYERLDASTGARLGAAAAEEVLAGSTRPDAQVDFPDPVASVDELGPAVSEHCKSRGSVGPAEHLVLGELEIVGYCVPASQEGKFRQMVTVINRADGKELFTETIAAAGSGFAPDSFFVHAGTMYVVIEQQSIAAVTLNERKEDHESG
jgi:hypothetical protein